MVGAGQDLLEIDVLALGQKVLAAAHDQPGEADDRVHRRPQLVAHVGQELGLRRLACSASSLAACSASSVRLRVGRS